MPKYKLSRLAKSDLAQIAIYGKKNFGLVQAQRYRAELKSHFQLIAAQPYLFQSMSHIKADYRRSVCGRHSIYYKIADDGVDIIRILGRQDAEKALFE